MSDEEKAKYGRGKKQQEDKASKPANKKKVILLRFCYLVSCEWIPPVLLDFVTEYE